MKKLGKILFKYRSYTPLPFVFLMIFFVNPSLYSIIAGFLIVISGEIIRIWAVSFAGSETRRTSEGVGGSNLVTQGPFAIIRNPLYLGNIMIYTGIGIMSYALFPFLAAAALLFFIFQYYLIILNEEEYLRNTYKEKFEMYCKTVKRFLPFPSKMPDDIKSHITFDLKEGLKSESRTLQAIAIVTIIILIFYFL